MKKSNFYIISFKKSFLPLCFVAFTISLVLFSKSNLTATKEGLLLWSSSVVPALFPFFVATELLSHTKIISFLGKKLEFLMRPIFNVPGEGSFAFIMGIISGYPIGAKIVTELRQDGICSKEESERLLAFTNNSRSTIYYSYCRYKSFCRYYNWYFTSSYSHLSMC